MPGTAEAEADADAEDEETTADKLLGAFDVATHGIPHVEEHVTIHVEHGMARKSGRVGRVTIPYGGSIVLNDSGDVTTIGEALELHGWEVGTIRSSTLGTMVSVWEADR